MPDQISIVQDHGFLSMLTGSGPIVQGVLVILVIGSVLSWAIAIAKGMHYRRVRADSAEFLDLFWETRNFSRIDDSARRLEASPLVRLFTVGYHELSKTFAEKREGPPPAPDAALSTVERLLRRVELEEAERLEKGLTFLATTASAAPFIGLFGTVWGIMNAFHGLGSATASTTIQAVAPGISEALVATAIGLAAAIPAAVAYNYFAVALRNMRAGMSTFIADFLTVAQRSFLA